MPKQGANGPETAGSSVDRRTLLKQAAATGLVLAAGSVIAKPAEAQVPDDLRDDLHDLSHDLVFGHEKPLGPNQVEIVVPTGREVLIREVDSPDVEVHLRVAREILTSTQRTVLVMIPSPNPT